MVARPVDDQVIAAVAVDRVGCAIALPAQPVAAGIADQGVGKCSSREILDVEQSVHALARVLSNPLQIKINMNAGGGPSEECSPIEAVTAVDIVVALAAV